MMNVYERNLPLISYFTVRCEAKGNNCSLSIVTITDEIICELKCHTIENYIKYSQMVDKLVDLYNDYVRTRPSLVEFKMEYINTEKAIGITYKGQVFYMCVNNEQSFIFTKDLFTMIVQGVHRINELNIER